MYAIVYLRISAELWLQQYLTCTTMERSLDWKKITRDGSAVQHTYTSSVLSLEHLSYTPHSIVELKRMFDVLASIGRDCRSREQQLCPSFHTIVRCMRTYLSAWIKLARPLLIESSEYKHCYLRRSDEVEKWAMLSDFAMIANRVMACEVYLSSEGSRPSVYYGELLQSAERLMDAILLTTQELDYSAVLQHLKVVGQCMNRTINEYIKVVNV